MRVLLISANAGAGHVRAAKALEAAVRELHPEADVENVEILSFTKPIYRRTYADAWLQMADRAPALWGYLYATSNRGRTRTKPPALVRAFDRMMFAGFRARVRELAPDHVIATHFLPAQVLAAHRREPWCAFSFGCVLTDFDCHAMWAQPSFDRFCVGNDELVEMLADKGILRERVAVTGIPIDASFSRVPDRLAARRSLGLEGAGAGRPVHGRRHGARQRGRGRRHGHALRPRAGPRGRGQERGPAREARRAARAERHVATALGFVDNMAELMAAADLAVGKSGGLTSSECLASGVPMLIPDPIPGQEERNADWLVEVGAAWKARGLGSLRAKLTRLLADAELRAAMARNAKAHGRPGAAAAAVRALLG
jgi:processive 1,2-diacylglycerol beta-glucosyltransferase